MTKVCRGGNLVPEGQTEWTIPALPNHQGEQDCESSGGTVVEIGGGCGTTQTMQARSADGIPGMQSLVAGAFVAAHHLRSSLEGSDLIADLDLVDNAGDVVRIIGEDETIRSRIADGVGIAGGLAVDLLIGDGPAASFEYSAELHDYCVAIGRDLQRQLSDQQARDAIDRIADRMSLFVGMPLGEVHRTLKGDGRDKQQATAT